MSYFRSPMKTPIDEDVLARLMRVTGVKTKAEAAKLALAEPARRHRLKELFSQGLGLAPDELAAAFASNPADLLDDHGLGVAGPQASRASR